MRVTTTFIRLGALTALTLATMAIAQEPFSTLKDDHQLRRPIELPAPPLLHRPFTDPHFGTRVMRITEPAQIKGVERVRHYYSKMNPFNADNSRAIMFSSDGHKWLYDTATWKPLGELAVSSSDPEIQWHPSDPSLFYFMDFSGNSKNVRAMYRYDIRDHSKKLLRDFNQYESARGQLEGNLDNQGRYYALIGTKGKDHYEAFVYDIAQNKTSTAIKVSEGMIEDWISVSQSGQYVVIMGNDRSRVYDITMKHVRDLPYGSFGHADLCLTADGHDVMVYDGADHQLDRNRNINVAELATGKVSVGTRIGWRSTPHVSCRNTALPGWALVSTQGPDEKYPFHDFEIFWLKLDGSGDVRRVAHHHSSRERGGYFAEQHAVTNRDGSLIIFASNWNGDIVSDYLVDLRPSTTTTSTVKK